MVVRHHGEGVNTAVGGEALIEYGNPFDERFPVVTHGDIFRQGCRARGGIERYQCLIHRSGRWVRDSAQVKRHRVIRVAGQSQPKIFPGVVEIGSPQQVAASLDYLLAGAAAGLVALRRIAERSVKGPW